ncbi:MAG: amidinotransferase [Myxococcales bacterium]|nr:amidinotransferase [Myxococcales bacterium]
MSAIGCVDCHSEDADECHYRVAWSINPHMRIGAVCPVRARAQLTHYARALRAAGARVVELPFVHGAYDSVFAKDSAILFERNGERHALIARPRCRQRGVEQRARHDVLAAHGFVVAPPPAAFLEGGDVVVAPDDRELFVGYGFRSERRALRYLERFADRRATPLRLCNPLLYHLDMALALLADGSALACREAFDAESFSRLESSPAIRRLVTVPLSEALTFALNLVEVGGRVLMDGESPTVTRAVKESGLSIERVDLSEFRLAGGSAACLVATVHRPQAAASRTIYDATVLSA